MDGKDKPLTSEEKKRLRVKLLWFKRWKKFIDAIPNQHPILQPSKRPVGSSNVFFYRLAAFNYGSLAEQWFEERNKTYRQNFSEYLTQLYSMLIEPELRADGTLAMESSGVQLQSLDLKKINRNYAEFNDVLFREGFLELISVHDADEKKCRAYAAPAEILRKGIEKVFLSKAEKQALVKSIRISKKPDQTSKKLEPVCRYFSRQLKKTKIDAKHFEQMEIGVGQLRKLYPRVVRFRLGKHDLKINAKEGRFYSTYIYAPKMLRKLLRWEGKQPMVEGDVAGSHFHFLLEEMTDPKERAEMRKDLLSADPYLAMCCNPKGVTREDLKGSSHLFKNRSRLKRYPKMNKPDWAELRWRKRTLLYREGLFYRHISTKYPKFATTMAGMKIFGKNQKSKFACGIMRKESMVMVHMAGERCMKEKLVYLPIHDGFLTLPKHYDRVCKIVTECFKMATGTVPNIRQK